jgi:hypothetical protein
MCPIPTPLIGFRRAARKLVTEALERLAKLIRERNRVDADISEIIARPALASHLGEFIAAAILNLKLNANATKAAFDARFCEGQFKGKTVNIKCYGKREGILDLNEAQLPDFYLVMTGPLSSAATSRNGIRPFLIDEVFLFDAQKLLEAQRMRGVKFGVASSVPKRLWDQARIFPMNDLAPFPLPDEACRLLSLFCSRGPNHGQGV